MIDGGTFFVIVFGGIMGLTVFYIVLWHILHFILCKKYDDLLFKEPIYKPMELAIYSSWPLSLVRSMGYILLIAAPNFIATRRRFKGIAIDQSDIFFLRLFCKAILIAGILTLLLFLIMFIAVIEPELISSIVDK